MKIEVNNITLYYKKEGEGSCLILLHGNGESHQIFDELVYKLKQDFTVYAIDSRNHGENSVTNDYSYDTMAEDIYQLIQKLNLTDVSIIGFSDGAIIALLLSLKYETLFQKMVLMGVNLKPSDFKKEIYDSLLQEYEKSSDPLLKLMLEEPNIELDELKKIKSPTLIVAAEDDIFNEKIYNDIADVIPNSLLKIMIGHDHGSYIINNDLLYNDLKEFLK